MHGLSKIYIISNIDNKIHLKKERQILVEKLMDKRLAQA
jgi:hypothetical protein